MNFVKTSSAITNSANIFRKAENICARKESGEIFLALEILNIEYCNIQTPLGTFGPVQNICKYSGSFPHNLHEIFLKTDNMRAILVQLHLRLLL